MFAKRSHSRNLKIVVPALPFRIQIVRMATRKTKLSTVLDKAKSVSLVEP